MVNCWLGIGLFGDVNEIRGSIVSGRDVVGGLKLFDEAGFEEEGFDFGLDLDEAD